MNVFTRKVRFKLPEVIKTEQSKIFSPSYFPHVFDFYQYSSEVFAVIMIRIHFIQHHRLKPFICLIIFPASSISLMAYYSKAIGWWKYFSLCYVMCTQRGGNERKSHKYTNCMLKGLNLKCNIHRTERKDVGRCKDDENLRGMVIWRLCHMSVCFISKFIAPLVS